MSSNINPTLALQQGLKRHMDGIVKAATEAALLLQDGNLQKNQIRNVLNVAEESSNVAVVTNFIRYQIGRSGTGKEWQHNGFGLRVIEDITAGPVQQTVANVIKVVSDRLGSGAVTAELKRQAHVDLMRHYLGYLNRAFIFGSLDNVTDPKGQNKKKGWDYLQQVAAQEVKDV
ncbi:MAG: hypothetical protein KDJ65_21615 [Anaerolineae bacterium]|nr:hypothetical protein [Anaerolineae bacterium]